MRRKLLLADDSITVQRVIELTFSEEGLDIVTVGDGAQAIERLQQDRPDIVLADLDMPGPNGYAVAEHVKRGSDLVDHTRVVLLTTAFEPVDQDRARGLGVDGVLAKPFEPQVAIELVRQLLEQAPLSPPRLDPPVETVSDWTALTDATQETPRSDWGEEAAGGEADETPVTAVSAGYPFEPGTATARSTPAELDDYFQRLDEALTSAGLTASPAVRNMLAETKGPEGGARATERAASVGSTVEEEKSQSSGTPSTGGTNVTLVDAFSALLAAEQVSGPAGTNLEFWAPSTSTPQAASAAPAESGRVEVVVENARPFEDRSVVAFESRPESGASEAAAASANPGGPAEVLPMSEADVQAASAAASADAAAPAVSEAQIEAIVRRVVEEMSDRLVREIAQAKVIDVAERLVREEIDRLKAAASEEAS
jgi:CheY-like chemotaxis protein